MVKLSLKRIYLIGKCSIGLFCVLYVSAAENQITEDQITEIRVHLLRFTFYCLLLATHYFCFNLTYFHFAHFTKELVISARKYETI